MLPEKGKKEKKPKWPILNVGSSPKHKKWVL
jgi:hypothetical protein